MNPTTSYEATRRFFARFITAVTQVSDTRIINAFANTKREHFVGPAPWHIRAGSGYIITETDDPIVLYQDVLVGLDPARYINNGQPSLHAASIGAVMPQAGDVIIHAGAGTGYYSAILSQLAGGTGKVHAFEIDAGLAERATQNLAAFKNVSVLARSALETPLPPADVIYVCAGATHVPAIWLDTLTIGGRLVLPLTPNERLGCMLLVTRKSNDTYTARCFFSNVGFIPCIGARDDEQSRALAAALDKGSMKDVKSLHRNTQPDDSAWCIGKDWWLSTTEPQG